LPKSRIDPKKLVKGHVTLEEVITMFDPKKVDDYKSNSLDLALEGKK